MNELVAPFQQEKVGRRKRRPTRSKRNLTRRLALRCTSGHTTISGPDRRSRLPDAREGLARRRRRARYPTPTILADDVGPHSDESRTT